MSEVEVGLTGFIVTGIGAGGETGRVGGAEVGKLQAKIAINRETENIQ